MAASSECRGSPVEKSGAMVDNLEAYLLATGQLSPLAARQARVLSRSVSDKTRADDARAVFLLALAALGKGVPRAGKEYLLAPISDDSVETVSDSLEREGTPLSRECLGAIKNPAAFRKILAVLDALFRDPSLFAPLSGPVPAAGGEWPLLAVDAAGRQAGFSRYYKAVIDLETGLGALLKTPLDKVKDKALASIFGTETILRSGKFHFRQAAAAALALRSRFLIVSGGPGTGKTIVVTQILRALVRVFDIQPDRIVLCAPTGRAKAHLGEVVDMEIAGLEKRAAEEGTPVDPRDKGLKGLRRKTVHGLLSIRPDNSAGYDAKNPLPYEVIVVDEASMVDLCLFSRLIAAAPPDCRIILVGDMHQLPSVEAGAVLGDLTERFCRMDGYPTLTGETAGWITAVMKNVPVDGKDAGAAMALSADGARHAGLLADRTVILTKNYRSSAGGGGDGIARLSAFVNRGEWEGALKLLAGSGNGAVRLDDGKGGAAIREWLETHYAAAAGRLIKLRDLDPDAAQSRELLRAAFETLDSSRILTLVHEGPRGRLAINRLAEKILRNGLGISGRKGFFHGQPVIMTRNHHALDVYNGDTGIVVQERTGGLKAVFRRGNGLLNFAVDRLSGLEPAFAMTVHKAQGSEFDEVLLVLPDYGSPLLFRQIIYTGITRARSRVVIMGSEDLLRHAIETPEARPGGVRLA
ncbi:MAG: exodeoxyribonuclease V subunit alpha [Chitinispirillaceae bacterium]|nr:exodeoxyribonuclease V subunit alpha [Chitinispirillaceae bacterium]